MVKFLLLLCFVYMGGLRDDSYDKEVMKKSDILKESSILISTAFAGEEFARIGSALLMLNLTHK